MNGVYGRIHDVPILHAHRFHWAYHNQLTGWVMGLAMGAEDGASYETFGGKGSEWLIIDSQLHDRFGHVGETVIPGAGAAWEHLHRSAPFGPVPSRSAGEGAVDERPVDAEDELPWQVIYIGDPNMVSLSSPVADVAGASPVFVQMWQRRFQSRCRYRRVEPMQQPGLSAVPVQMWQG